MDINERLARTLRQLRHERGLSIAELADRSGVSRAMISRIERAQSSPTATVMNDLSTGLGVLLQELFGPSSYREPRLRDREFAVLRAGDCMAMKPEQSVAIHNTGGKEARYLLAAFSSG